MKPQIRNWLYFLVIISFLSTVLTGCDKKDDNDSPDFASAVAGTYNGSITAGGIGTTSGSTTITRVNATRINLLVTIATTSVPLDGITVSSTAKDVYNLSYTDASGSLTGTVTGNTCNWTMTDGTDVIVFTGTR